MWSISSEATEHEGKRQVTSGDTLWRIASELKPSNEVSVAQVMQALFELNRDAFTRHDINQLQNGRWLIIPSYTEIAGQNATEALQRATDARAAVLSGTVNHPLSSEPVQDITPTLILEDKPFNSSEKYHVQSDVAVSYEPQNLSADVDLSDDTTRHTPNDIIQAETVAGFWSDVEWYSQLNLMQRWFPQQGLQQQQQWHHSVSLEMEWYWQSDDRSHTVVVSPYIRWDQQDSQRHLIDIAEAYWLYFGVGWEVRAGIDKVFWGAVESQRLVDIINQRDLLEQPDGESKLGQPMVQFSLIRDFGTIQAYLLPYFRERSFAGSRGRLRLPFVVDTDRPDYESSRAQNQVDWALRWSQQFSSMDLGLSYFQGTSRDPMLLPNVDGMLTPYYSQLKQVGLDGQWILGSWLWKIEAVYRENQFESYTALISGFEYTQIGISDRFWDLGWLVEYQYDSRGLASTAIGQNDIFVGWRLALNDAAGSEILFGALQDLDRSSSRTGYLEVSTRLSDRFRLRLDGWFFDSDEPDDLVYWLRRDSFIQLTLEYYF